MSFPVRLRRPFVVLGVLISLLVGVGTVRVAAAWTASSSPLVARPPSVEALQAALSTEQERSTALKAQLDDLSSGSADLAAALEAARGRISADTAQAAEMAASLKAAKAKLASLAASIRAAQGSATRPGSTSSAPAAATGASHEADREVDDGD
jgi:uncharacterized protein YlxW (UPF0749 family)